MPGGGDRGAHRPWRSRGRRPAERPRSRTRFQTSQRGVLSPTRLAPWAIWDPGLSLPVTFARSSAGYLSQTALCRPGVGGTVPLSNPPPPLEICKVGGSASVRLFRRARLGHEFRGFWDFVRPTCSPAVGSSPPGGAGGVVWQHPTVREWVCGPSRRVFPHTCSQRGAVVAATRPLGDT